jgi:hypothetical protein
VANLRGSGTGAGDNGDFFLKGSGPEATVFDGVAVDVLDGGPGLDWFFARLAQDILQGRGGAEIVERL